MNAPDPTTALTPPVTPALASPPAAPGGRAAPAAPPGNGAAAKPGAPKPGKADMSALLDEPAVQPWYQRRWLWAGVAGAVLLVAGVAWWWSSRSANATPSYSTQPVARGALTLTVTANGTVQPTRSINIGSELSGTVLKVNVDVNDRIKKGQVLVVLDTAKLRDQILRSQAAVASAQARAEQAAATTREAQAVLGRLEAVALLSGGKVPSKAELDAGRAALARAVADDGSARAGISDARAALSTDQINLSKASITAPADGVVLTRTVDPGNAVAASLQAVTLFTVAEDLARLRLWVYVDESDVGVVKVGQNATFTVSAYPSRPFPARITRVGFGSTITDNVVTYLTYLDVDNTDLSLRPGMTATATIVATERSDALLVPNAALRFAPTAAVQAKKGIASGIAFGPPKTESRRKGAADGASTANARQVWVLPAQGQPPVAVAVQPGISDGRMTEIIGGDLKVGMQVITAQKAAGAK
jgi:HlyD family secretion protein